jgi:hypothetical protein
MKWLVLAVLLVLVMVGAGLAIYYGTRNTKPKSPQVLQQPTQARRVRPLKPGPEPGIPAPRIRPEKHSRDG